MRPSGLLGSSPAWQWVPSAPFDDFSGSWRTSQEGAWRLARSDTDNWIRQDSGTRKLFSFHFYSAEVRGTFHSVFLSAQGQILQDDTEYLQFPFASLGTEGPQPVTGLDLFYCTSLFLTMSKTDVSLQIYWSIVSCRDHRSSSDDEDWTEMTLQTM